MIKTTTILTKLTPENGLDFNPPEWVHSDMCITSRQVNEDNTICIIEDIWPDLKTKYNSFALTENTERYRQRLEWCKLANIEIRSRSELIV